MGFLANLFVGPFTDRFADALAFVSPMPLSVTPSVHPPASLLAVGFSVILVLSLVAAEEVELRRGGEPRS